MVKYKDVIKINNKGVLMKDLLNSIYSDSTGFYVSNPYPRKGETIEIKLRIMDNAIVDKVLINYKKLGMVITEEMKLDYTKNSMNYYKVSVPCLEDSLRYRFIIVIGDKLYFYTQQRITEHLPDEAKDFKILVDYDAPTWMKETVFYQIMPDRFYNARPELTVKAEDYRYQGQQPMNMEWGAKPLEYEDAHCMDFYGGDLYGIIEKLDYLQDLGVNGIYLNPIFKSPTMHKYDALDYFEIDPSLGGDEALAALTKEMHKRGMRLVLDISINHTSSSSKWFNKTAEFYPKEVGAFHNPDAPERDYYFINEDGSYHCWLGVETMPTLNYSSEALRKIIYKDEDSVLKKWLKEPYNIDGWRFDVADVMGRIEELDVYHELWRDIYREIKKTKSDAVIIAEEWTDAWEMYDAKQWDSTMNYFQTSRPIREFVGQGDLFLIRDPNLAKVNYKSSGINLKDRIIQFMDKVPSQVQYQMFNLINSHDVPRIYSDKSLDMDLYKGAVLTLFGIPGAVNIYYGDEKHLDGWVETVEGCRYSMDWSEDLPAEKQEIFDLYRMLARLKSSEIALQDGGFKVVQAEEDLFAFSRFSEDEVYLFIWNRMVEASSMTVDLSQFGYNKPEAKVLFGECTAKINEKNLEINLESKASALIEIIL